MRQGIDEDVSKLLPMIQDVIFNSCSNESELMDKEAQIVELTKYLSTCRIYELLGNRS